MIKILLYYYIIIINIFVINFLEILTCSKVHFIFIFIVLNFYNYAKILLNNTKLNLNIIKQLNSLTFILTNICIFFRRCYIPSTNVILFTKLGDLFKGHYRERNIAFVRQENYRYVGTIRKRNFLPQIVQPFFDRLERCYSRDVENQSCSHSENNA